MSKKLINAEKVNSLFTGWDDAMFRAVLEGRMGEVLVPDTYDPEAVGENGQTLAPESACLRFADFYLFGGKPEEELLNVPMGEFSVLTPADEAWEKLLGEHFPAEEKAERYAIRKDTVFDKKHLEELTAQLPEGVKLCRIDGELYDLCMANHWSMDFVQTFSSKEDFLTNGLGIVAVKDGEILAGCSSYARCSDAIEVEVDTRKDQRRKHLATACAAKLILTCLEQGLYPSWDAMNKESLGLSEKLGYHFSHAYPVYNHDRTNDGNGR